MPNPTGRDLHVDRMLTNISIGYKNADYIADEIFPIVEVLKRSDLIPEYEKSHWFRSEAKKRAPGTKSVRSGYGVKHDQTYYCHRYSFGHEIFDEDRDNTDAPFDLDRDGTEFVTDKLQMARETNFADNFFVANKWGQDKVGGTDFTKFSDYAGSDPLGVISDNIDSIEDRVVVEPNTLVLGKKVFTKLKWHPDLIDLIKYTQTGKISKELMASLLEIPRILIGKAIRTTSPEGTAESSVTYSRIWGKHMLMLYVTNKASLMRPTAGYTFTWKRVKDAIQWIKRMRDEEREVDIIEANSYFDQKITGADSGLFMQDAIA